MNQPISLREAERNAFALQQNDGLWDILLACFLLIFALAPLVSNPLGDFWSSAIFLPFWGLVYLAILLIRKHIVKPRMGEVKFGPARKQRLARFSLIMVAVNLLMLILGILVFSLGLGRIWLMPVIFLVVLVAMFSLAAHTLDLRRFFFYGLLAGLAPIVGEWLFQHGMASHHGFPLMFGIVCGVIGLVGIILFILFLRNNPLPEQEA